MSTQVGAPPVNHNPNEPSNGRTPTIPAVPSQATNGNSFDHKRTPSMTVTPAGATGPSAHSTPQNKSNIQFGSVNAGNSGASPAVGTPPSLAHQPSASLGVNNLGPRMPSPSNSPSPIPQPSQVSGGRPPPGVQGPGNGMSFGQFGGDSPDINGMNRQMNQMHLGQEHMRRGSSQSIHSDIGGPGGIPTAPGRGGYPNQGGRGRGGYQNNYGNQISYSPQHTFRPQHQNGRGSFQGRGGPQMQYQGSPSMQNRTPMMNPGTPQMNPMSMVPGGQQYAYGPYPGYGSIPITADPSISYNSQQYFYQGQYPPYGGPPQSPRPFQQPGYGAHMQTSYSSQGQGQGQGPTPMSRNSSQISATDRPSSGIGQTPQTPASIPHHASTRTPSMSGADIQRPQKRSQAIVIKNAAGEIVDFKKQAQQAKDQAPASPAPVPTPAPTVTSAPPVAATPPSRTGSAADMTHARTDSQSVKNDEEKKKAMQEAVARRIAEEKEQEAEKQRKQKEAEEEKLQMEKEAVQAAEREAAEKKAEAERLEREAKEAEEAARKAEEEKARAAEAPKEAPKPKDDEIDFEALAAEWEAEEAAREAEEARREEEYMKKKAAQKAAELKKEQEDAAAYEANMKELERKAEEEEQLRERKKNVEQSSDDEAKKMFAALKAGGSSTPIPGDESPAATPGESGTATPVSDVSMGPPGKGMGPGRRGKATELTLDTKKPIEPPEPSATLRSLTSAKMLADPSKVSYPSGIVSPNPALNVNAPADRKFKYNKEFLLQFQDIFKEKPSLDWDQKVREALGDGDSARTQTARTPSGMGGRSASNRPPAGNAFTGMGNFGGVRSSLPSGTTSEQRFAASQAALRGGPMGGTFPFTRTPNMGPPMGRTPSNNPMGPIPGSPRVGGASRGGSRAESKRAKQSAKQEAEHNKSMPLTAGMQIGNLEVSEKGWKARSIGQTTTAQSVGPDGYMEADVVQRKVKAALNKMTPEKFEKISEQILEIAAQSKFESDGRTLRQVIQLVFEKATDEAHWAPMYAQFCFKMLSNMSNDIKDEGIKDKNGNVVAGGNLFRKYLLNRCQEEFERGWKVNLPPKEEGESEEAVMLSDEYYIAAAAKRRGLGLVRFIGELFKLGMLTERIMHECVKKLLDYEGTPDEAEVESLSSLLRTIGRQLDDPESKAVGRMDAYFDRIKATISLPDLPSRLQFMLMDIVDLRKAGWVSKDTDKGPKTIQEIHEEAEAKRRDEEMAKLANQAGGRGGGGRMPMGRGDARSFSGYGQVPPPDNSNRVGAEDLRRLGGRNQRQSTTPSGSFGPSGLGARTNSGRRGLGPALSRPDESNASSRTGTPPAQKDKDKKDESSTNAFSALLALEGHDAPGSPPSNPSSPPTKKSQPIERERSRSPEKKD